MGISRLKVLVTLSIIASALVTNAFASSNGGKRTPAEEIMGMPAPQDMACRSAAGTEGQREALNSIEHSKKCVVFDIIPVELNKEYTVQVVCAGEHFDYTIITNKTAKGCLADPSKPPRRVVGEPMPPRGE